MTLTVALILDSVDLNEPFVLEADVNINAIESILMQGGFQVAFESKKFDHA